MKKYGIEKCKNFSVALKETHIGFCLEITTNTNKVFCRTLNKLSVDTTIPIKKLKVVCLSDKLYDFFCILYPDVLSDTKIFLEKESNHCYLELINGSIYTTDYKGQRKKVDKIGRLFKLLLPKLNDTEISAMVDKFNRTQSGIYTDSIEVQEDISEIYDNEHISKGTVGGSCMKGNGYYYSAFNYEENVKIAYLMNDDGVLIGRALLWYNVEIKNTDGTIETIKLMDRIYFSSEAVLISFEKYAQKHGYHRKHYQSYDRGNAVVLKTPNNKRLAVDGMKVYLDINTEDTELPYMDTFFTTDDNGIFSASHTYARELSDTDGNLTTSCCDHCGGRYHEDDLRYVNGHGYICEYCLENRYVYCEDIHDYVHADDEYFTCYYSGYNYASSDDMIYCEDIGDLVHTDDYTPCFCEDTGEYYYDMDNGYYTADEFFVTDLDNCYYYEPTDSYYCYESNIPKEENEE